MACTHPRIMSENCVIKCAICGAVLPDEYLSVPASKPAEKGEKPAENAESVKTPRKGGRKKVEK